MFWRCNGDCYSRDSLSRRQCGLEACLSSRRISHFLHFFFLSPSLFLPSHAAVFIHLSIIFLNSSLSVGNCSRTFVSLYVISTPRTPSSTSSSLPPSVAAAFLLQLRKGDPVMSHLTMGGGGKEGRGEKNPRKTERRGSPKLAFPSQSSCGVFRIAE